MTKLVLIRGLPGSGKSTLAQTYIGFDHYEADMWFMRDGVYSFSPAHIKEAHEWCQERTRLALTASRSVVVSNTFIKKWEMKYYIELAQVLAVPYEIVIATGNYKSIHDVPIEVVERMRRSFEY